MLRPTRVSLVVALAILGVAACALPAADQQHGPEADGSRARTGSFIGAEEGRIHYQVLGSAADTVVVLHGGPGAGIGSIRPAVAPLAEHFTLILYDQRGGGRSVLPEDTTLLAARYHVQDLEALRRHFGLERMKLFAHSFGPLIVARYAQQHPQRIDRLVFHGATGPYWDDAVRVARARGSHSQSPDTALDDRAAELLGALLRGEAEDPVEACREYEATGRRLAELREGHAPAWTGTSCDAPAEAVRYYFRHTAQYSPRTFGRWDFRTGLEHVRAPLLVISGTRDTMAAPLQRAWANALPNGRILEVPAAGKGAIAERPDLVIPAITDFLRSDS